MPTIIYSLEEVKEIFNKIGIKADKVEIIELNDTEPGLLVKTSTPIAIGTITETSAVTNNSISQPEEEAVEKENKSNKKRTKVDESIRKKFFSSLPPDQVPEILTLDETGTKRSDE